MQLYTSSLLFVCSGKKMGMNKCPECGDNLKLVTRGDDVYWVHTGNIDPDCFLRNIAE